MADCFDLEGQLSELKRKKAENEELLRRIDGRAEQLKTGTTPRAKRRLRLMDGDYLEINPQKFWDQVEKDAIEYGERVLAQQMRSSVEDVPNPTVGGGLNIPFSKLPPTQENVELLLDVLQLKLKDPKSGSRALAIKRPYTEGAANAQYQALAITYGADPRELAEGMQRRLVGIDRLPTNSYMVKRVRDEAVQVYAEALEEAADLIDLGSVTPGIKMQMGNIAQWAHYWTQFDQQVSKQIARALKARQFEWAGDLMVKFDKPIELFSLDDISGESFKAQVLQHITEGDSLKLRKLATTARLGELDKKNLVRSPLMSEIQTLNVYRKDSMYSSPATWLERNPISGATNMLVEGAVDIAEGALRFGVKEELEATAHAARAVLQGHGMAWRNAWDSFAYGKVKFNITNFEEVGPEVLSRARDTLQSDFNNSWELMTTPSYHLKNPGIGAAVTGMNLLQTGFRYYILDKLVDAAFSKAGIEGVTAGTMPAFRALNAGDEVIRKTAFDWKVNHEAYLRAAKEAKEAGGDVPKGWVAARAEELASKAVFSGLMSEADLAQLRLKELGMPVGSLDNDELRLKMFNDLHGTPNVGDELGRLGAERSDLVTFTQKLNDPFSNGVQLMRSNPLVGWVIPVWKVAANGFKWMLNNDVYVNTVRQLYLEAKNGLEGGLAMAQGKTFAEGALDPQLLAKTRARTLVSVGLAGITQQLWQNGLFSDGGPTDDIEREAWLRTNQPYSFSLAFGATNGMVTKFSGKSIDLIDLMGLQADLLAAWQRGTVGTPEFTSLMGGMVTAYARVADNKQSLSGLTSLFNLLTRVGRGQDVDVWGELAKQTNGILPLSGLFSQPAKMTADPNKQPAKFRQLTPAEYQALQKDPNWDFVQHVMSRIFRNYPGAGNAFPEALEERDWLWRKVERPLGLPSDLTSPFMPVRIPQHPLYKWMQKHGLGGKPRPSGRVSDDKLGVTAPTNMTLEQERTYREDMNTIVGEVPAAQLLGNSGALINVGNAVFSIDQYTKGRTLFQALDALRQDPEYNLQLDTPGGPSLVTQPRRKLSERTNRENDPRGVYQVFDGIVSYYDKLGIASMMSKHPEFMEMVKGNVGAINSNAIRGLIQSPQGAVRY